MTNEVAELQAKVDRLEKKIAGLYRLVTGSVQVVPDEQGRNAMEYRVIKVLKLLSNNFAEAFDVTAEDVLGESRHPEIVTARHLIWHAAHYRFGLNKVQIARFFKRDHSTVLHGIDRAVSILANQSMLKLYNQSVKGTHQALEAA